MPHFLFILLLPLKIPDPRSADTVTVTYVEADGSEKDVQAEIGKNLLEVAHDNNIELEGKYEHECAILLCAIL